MVFVLSSDRRPLDPCHPARARKLLKAGKAAILRYYPFTIILKNRQAMDSATQSYRVKLDPGSRTTGIAVLNEAKSCVIWAAELTHRGRRIRDALLARRQFRRGRRNRKTRYRKPRFDNRRRPEGWLSPSLESRVANILTWVRRLNKICPVEALSMELVRFDTQKLQNPEILGVEYQQGPLFGYEVREYLLEKWGRRCAYCGAENVPLEIEHIVPRARGGSNRVFNLTLACNECNRRKGTMTAAEFGHPDIAARAEQPLKDAATVNATRWALYRRLQATGIPVEVGSGGQTKYNRTRLGLPKEHWIDAACIGASTPEDLQIFNIKPLFIQAMGYGHRKMCGTDRHGFPIRHRSRVKRHHGFQSGDMVRAAVPGGKRAGVHVGRVLVRSSGSFDIRTATGRVAGISHRYCALVQRADGYEYAS